jgi:hypothetical protein
MCWGARSGCCEVSEIVAALFGAILAGLFQTLTGIRERKRERKAILTAIASEVDAICRLIRHQGYLEAVSQVASDVPRGMWNGQSYIIDIRSNYFVACEGLVGKIGLLNAYHVSKIVNFYAYCKSAIDSTRPDGPHANATRTEFAAANMVSVAHLLTAILSLGDEIVQLPKHSAQYQASADRKLGQ